MNQRRKKRKSFIIKIKGELNAKWEYKIRQTNPNSKADKSFEDLLNGWGNKGWELIGVQEKALYFKRPINPEIPIFKQDAEGKFTQVNRA